MDPAAGAIGIGAVWGWLAASVPGGVRRPAVTWPALTAASAGVAAGVAELGGAAAAAAFVAAAAVAGASRVGWERWLGRREGTA